MWMGMKDMAQISKWGVGLEVGGTIPFFNYARDNIQEENDLRHGANEVKVTMILKARMKKNRVEPTKVTTIS